MRVRSWLKIALRALSQARPRPLVIPPWSEMTPDDFARVQDAEWGRAIRSMGARLELRWAVYQ
jgi:hypothetical protein